jgi:hypothetical protein
LCALSILEGYKDYQDYQLTQKEAHTMKNVEIKTEGNILTVKIDLSKTFGPSKTGKTIIIASTEGNQAIKPGLFLGVNCYKKEK